MSKWEFYDEDDDIDLTEGESEPSFSFYDFKKWLTDQKHDPFEQESLRETVANGGINSAAKEELKKLFKKRVRDKVQNKIDDKLAKRKKK